jgi:hypothetical protein
MNCQCQVKGWGMAFRRTGKGYEEVRTALAMIYLSKKIPQTERSGEMKEEKTQWRIF